MLLKSIKYHNFRPFIGDQKIDLSMPDGKNVTVILGNNTFGKSTFVLSFIWCLYGESRFARAADILNKKVESAMKYGTQETASVEVEFEDNGILYTLNRTQRFTMGQNGYLNAGPAEAKFTYIDNKGESKSVATTQPEINNAIKSILPVDLSSFFFFEGEKTNEITKKDLSKSVKTLLGLDAFDNMKDHLYGGQSNSSPSSASVLGYYLEKQTDDSDENAKKELTKAKSAEKDVAALQTRIDELADLKKEYQSRIDEANEVLKLAEPSKILQKRRSAIARDLTDEKSDFERNKKKFLSDFNTKSFALFCYPLLDNTDKRLKEMDVADKGIKGLEVSAILELLKRGECLCGTDLHEGSVAYKNVKKYIDYLPPKSVGTLVRSMQESVEHYKDNGAAYLSDMEYLYKGIQRNIQKIEELSKEEKAILTELSKSDDSKVKKAESDLRLYSNRKRDAEEEHDRKIREQASRQNDYDNAMARYNQYVGKGKKTKEYAEYYAYAAALYQWVSNKYSEQEDLIRDKLNAYITEMFNNMYSGHRDIKIDNKFNIVMTVDGAKVDDTGGLRVIQYFAYVGALVRLAYEIMQEKISGEKNETSNSSESLGEQYPLVLDAAFSHADEGHVKSIARELSQSVSQLIFAVMAKDWQYAKTEIEDKVGKVYELQKIDETEVKIVEVV